MEHSHSGGNRRPHSSGSNHRRGGTVRRAHGGSGVRTSSGVFRQERHGRGGGYGERSRGGESRGFSRGGDRPRFGGRPHGNRSRNRGPQGERIDVSRFVNKAVITEEAEHFVPEHAFNDFAISDELKRAIAAKGFISPTPIQDKSIPHTLHGLDVVGIANTGTGKTGAFLIPLIDKALRDHKAQSLIIVPTRELAIQIEEELKGFTKHLKIHSVCAFGGSNINRQIDSLRRFHQHFVIGTPGRLKDLIERRALKLNTFGVVVLDEADRMLDMGFINDMRSIMSEMPADRQTLFFSATLSPDIEKLIHEFLNEPVRISVKTRDTSKNIDQDIVRVGRGDAKFDALVALLKKPEFVRTLIFGRTKHGVEKLSKMLLRQGIKAESIHGNKNNNRRQYALKLFKDGRATVLVATDVAARGLDIANVSHVINYDLPATYDDYVHRIGRTGRGEKKGIALTFIEG